MLKSVTDGSDLSPVITPDAWFWAKLVRSVLRIFRTFLMRRRWRLVFVERSFSGWTSGQIGEKWIITLRSHLTVTNPNDRSGVIVVRVQVGRTGLLNRRALQDCHFCDIAGERVSPLSPGVLVEARTTAMMEITHPFERTKRPGERTKTLSFRVIATDQFNRRHIKRIKVQRFGA